MARPQEPTPEMYDLSWERVRILKDPIRFESLLEKPMFWVFYGGFVIVAGVWLYQATESVALTFLILLMGGALAPLFAITILGVLISSVISGVWRFTQPDYSLFSKYEKAVTEYHENLQRWIRTQERWWQSLDGTRFEVELGALLQNRGFQVQWMGRAGDEGVDLILRKGSREIIVQCKAHKRAIGPAAVRDLYGTMIHRQAREAWLVSTAGFSVSARRFASGKSVRLVEIGDVIRREDIG